MENWEVPLCVDLDRTLIRTDVLLESILILLKRNPFSIVQLLVWSLYGFARLKQEVCLRALPDVAQLPYRSDLLAFLVEQHRNSRPLVLVTAADRRVGCAVAEHLGIFSRVLASDGVTNHKGQSKADALVKAYGAKQFDYVGNSSADLAVWRQARMAVVVGGDTALEEKARKIASLVQAFGNPQSQYKGLLQAMRIRQWIKNLLVFIPLITSHNLLHPGMFMANVLAFLSFCFCASSVYLLNDLMDIESDRHHSIKKERPFAAGAVPIEYGMIAIPLLLVISGVLASYLPPTFCYLLVAYYVTTLMYSVRLKKIVMLDVIMLAGFYTMRILAGHEAAGVRHSFWLLGFSMFLFLSLALIKRYSELYTEKPIVPAKWMGRGYYEADMGQLASLGTASGYLAVLVFMLYINSPEVVLLYPSPALLWLICPLLLYWLSRFWLITSRGWMNEDPVVFAIGDRVSYYVGILIVVLVFLASRSWS